MKIEMRDEMRAEEAMGRFRAGDPEAFNSVYEVYRSPVLAFFFRRLYDKTLALEVEDLTEEVFVRLQRGGWKRDSPLGPYIWTIARNLLNDRLRQFKRAQKHAAVADYVDKQGNSLLETLPATGDFEEQFEFVELFRKAMGGLPPDERELLTLVCSGGIHPSMLRGGCWGESANAVNIRLARARKALRRRLEELGYFVSVKGR